MPLYNSNRDAGFLLGVNREIMHGYSSVEVGIYKLNLLETDVDIYEESKNRAYKPPVRIYAQIRLDEKSSVDSEFGLDYERTFAAGFLQSDLIDSGLYLEEGDIIEYDGGFYEIDQVGDTNYWSGRNPDTMIGQLFDGWARTGYRISIIAQAHLTRTNSLNIIDVDTGINDKPNFDEHNAPKFL